ALPSDAAPVPPAAPIVVPPAPPPAAEPLPAAGVDPSPNPGQQVTIRGRGYAPNSKVRVVLYSDPIDLGEVLTDENGEFSLPAPVPPVDLGSHTIASLGIDETGAPQVMTLPVTVVSVG